MRQTEDIETNARPSQDLPQDLQPGLVNLRRKTEPRYHGANTAVQPLVRREGDSDCHGPYGYVGDLRPAVRDQPTADLPPPAFVSPAHLRGRVQQHQPRPAQLEQHHEVAKFEKAVEIAKTRYTIS